MADVAEKRVKVSLVRTYPDGARYHQVHVLANQKKADEYVSASKTAAASVGAKISDIVSVAA